jgi:hypothetical protein
MGQRTGKFPWEFHLFFSRGRTLIWNKL